MRAINNLLIAISKKWWAVLLVIVCNFASFGILFGLEDQFEAITGVPVYDTQNELTAELLREQLPLYTGAARDAYLRFAAFDFVFPLVAGIFVAVVWTLLLRFNRWRFAQRLLLWNLPLFPLLGTGWDWLENVSLLTILNAGSAPSQSLIDTALLFKRLKLLWLSLDGAGVGVLGMLLVLNMIYRRVRRPRLAVASTIQ